LGWSRRVHGARHGHGRTTRDAQRAVCASAAVSRKADSTVGCEIDTRRQISADVTGYPVVTIELEVEAALGASMAPAWAPGDTRGLNPRLGQAARARRAGPRAACVLCSAV
jgi:xylulokinase